MSLCRRVVGTSLLAITLLGMSSVGVNKVAADYATFESEITQFANKFKGEGTSKSDETYKKAVSELSDDALIYLMARVAADHAISDSDASEYGKKLQVAKDLNYLGTSNGTDERARKIVFAEMEKRITERDIFRDETRYQQGQNSKLSAENQTLTEAIEKTKEEKAKLSQDLNQKTTDLKNLTEQFRLTLLKDESDKKQLETERDELATQLSQANQSNAELEAKAKELKEQADTATQNLQTSQEKVKELDQKVAAATTQNKALQTQLDKGQNDLATLQKRFEDATKSNSEEKTQLQQELEAKKKEVAGLQSQVTDSTNKLKVLEAAQKAAEVKVAELTEQKAAIETKLQQQSDLSAQDKAKLEQKLADVQAKITDKEKAIKALEEAKAQVEEKLKNQSQLSEQEKAQLQKELQDLMAKLEALKKNQDQAPSVPETPEVKPEDTPKAPETPEVAPEKEQNKPDDKAPGKHSIPWTALTPAQPIPSPKDKATPKPKVPQANTAGTGAFAKSAQLPATGEKTSPFFTAAALAVIVSSGVLARKRKEN